MPLIRCPNCGAAAHSEDGEPCFCEHCWTTVELERMRRAIAQMYEIIQGMEDRHRDAPEPMCPECGERSPLKTWRNKPGQAGTVYVCEQCAQEAKR